MAILKRTFREGGGILTPPIIDRVYVRFGGWEIL